VSAKSIKKTHNKGKHLYFIQVGEYIKIGRTDDVNKRLKQLEAMNPYDVELIEFIEGAGELEHSLHDQFKDRLHRGEWFRIRPCEVVTVGKVEYDG
jgi:hypothetical protein